MTKNRAKLSRSSDGFKHMIIHVTDVKYLGDYRLHLTFDDGVSRVVDLWPRLKNRKGVFEPLKDKAFFAKVTVDPEVGTIAWPNDVDWAPDVLYQMESAG